MKHNCFANPKLISFIRSSPAWKFKNFINDVDSKIHEALESILNVQLKDHSWTQATLPINLGGIGIRKLKDISLPAFLSSTHGVSNLVSLILHNSDKIDICHVKEAIQQWKILNDSVPLVPEFQKNWDIINMQRIINEDLQFSNPIDIARFKALQCSESNSWLKAIPSPNIGTFLDNNSIRICMGLRLGSPICRPHICSCGTSVTEYGIHGLSCQKSAGRLPKHSELNNIVYQSMSSINVPATLEPAGLSRDDGKKPDGLTLIPWSKGKCLVWDSTCVDTFADTYLQRSVKKARSAAELAHNKKHEKHSYIKFSNYIFIALAVETMGPYSVEALNFIKKIGSKLVEASGDIRAKEYLFQRISLAIQRGNVASILKTIPETTSMDEIFYL